MPMTFSGATLARMRAHLADPPHGSAAARAREFGIDLTLISAHLTVPPTTRIEGFRSLIALGETMRRTLR